MISLCHVIYMIKVEKKEIPTICQKSGKFCSVIKQAEQELQ